MDAKRTSSTHSPGAPPPFGSRFLTADADVWAKNAWDHVPPPPEHGAHIARALQRQRTQPVPAPLRQKYNARPADYWDAFYALNSANFFRDRNWLHLEFPELLRAAQPGAGPVSVFEPGCGVGNALFPLLAANANPQLRLLGCDYSQTAIDVIHANPIYTSTPRRTLHCSVWDLSSASGLPPSVPPASIDILVLIFVLSALHPAEWARAISNIWTALKPNGLVLLRDYGRHDMAQLRFKEGRLLGENFYVRGDGTRVYFFELDELALLFTGSRAVPVREGEGERGEEGGAGAEEGEGEGEAGREREGLPDGPADESDEQALRPEPPGEPADTRALAEELLPELQHLSLLHPAPCASTSTSTSTACAPTQEHQPASPSSQVAPLSTPPLTTPTPPAVSNPIHPNPRPTPTTPADQDASTHSTPSPPPTPNPEPSPEPNLDPTTTHTPAPNTTPNPPLSPAYPLPPHPLFAIEQLGVDRRLLVNRKRQLKMYRVWMQGKFRKL